MRFFNVLVELPRAYMPQLIEPRQAPNDHEIAVNNLPQDLDEIGSMNEIEAPQNVDTEKENIEPSTSTKNNSIKSKTSKPFHLKGRRAKTLKYRHDNNSGDSRKFSFK